MRILFMIGFAGLLLSSAPALAQADKPAATVTPTELPGEENLSAQERAERDFIMPARRKQDAILKAAREEAAQAETDVTALTPAEGEEAKAPEAAEAKAPAAAPKRTYHHYTSHRRPTSSKRKVVHHTTTSKHKTVAKKPVTRRK